MIDIQAAVVRDAGGPFRIEALQLEPPREHEVLVRIVGVGICHTDLSARDQHLPVRLPAVFGHEGAGVVEAVGAGVRKVAVGDHVVASFGSCGVCPRCRERHPAYCAQAPALNFGGRRMSDGSVTLRDAEGRPVHGSFFSQSSFASHALASEANVVPIARDLPLEMMGPLGCGLQTGAGAVLNVLKPAAGAKLAIFGVGAVGLAAVMAARIAGCSTIIAIDRHAARLQLAAELGATQVLEAGRDDVAQALRALGGVDASIDSTGHPAVIRQAVDALRPAGTCLLLGMAERGAELRLDPGFLLNGRSLRGVVEGDSEPDRFIPELIGHWRAGRFPFDRLLRFYGLDQINDAVADAAAGRVVKPVLRPRSSE